MPYIYQCVTGSRKYLPTEDGLPPLGNALKFWDTKQRSGKHSLVDHKTIFL
jgi:leucyl-tRNA synthetase